MKLNKKFKYYFVILVLILISIVGIKNSYSKRQKLTADNSETNYIERNAKEVINTDSKSTDELYNIINSYIDNYSMEYDYDYRERIGLVYWDINYGQAIEINSDKQFVAASTYKLILNIATYSEAIKGNITLEDKVYYQDADFEDGESIIDIDGTEPYTVQELLDSSIINSDNTASHMIYRYLGGRDNAMKVAAKVLGIEINTEENYESAENLKVALEYVYNNRDNKYYSHLLDIMTKTIYNDRLDKYLPAERVAHKVGMYENYVHDVGIILTEDPYILSVFTEDVEDGYEFIAGLSKAIYDYKVGSE